MSASFVTLGMLVSVAGYSLGIDEQMVSAAAAAMIVFGAILLVPQFSARFATATVGVGEGADATLDRVGTQGLTGQFVGGALRRGLESLHRADPWRRDLAGQPG